MNKNSQVLKQTIPYLFAFLGCLGIRGIMATSADITYTNSFFAILFFGISVYLQNRIIPDFLNAKKREKVCSVILALFISVALHLGAQFESNDSAELAAKELVIYTISFAIYMTPIINACFEGVKNFFSKKKVVSEERVNFLKVWLAIFGLWIPTFLAMYPGAFVYDATDEYNEVLNGVYNTHHPLIHVLSLGGLIRCTEKMGLGANAGIATYTILQMIITSLIFAYVLKKCFEWGMSKRYVKVWVVIIGLFPVFTLYSVCSAKDTLFSACFLLVIVFITEFIKTEKIKVGLIVASVFMMLLRNNGAYAYLVSIPVILIILCVSDKNKKKTYLKLGGVMICSLLVYKGTEKLIIYATGASNNEHQEMLTVPIQQLGRVYNFAPETLND